MNVKKEKLQEIQIFISLQYFSKLFTLPTAIYNIKSFDLISGQSNFNLLLEPNDYRRDGYYDARQIYFGLSESIFFLLLFIYFY